MIGDRLAFLRNFAVDPRSVGAVAPSSPALVAEMVGWFDWQRHRRIVEYGPGTGVFTEAIVAERHPEAKFFAIELSADMVDRTRRRCPGVDVQHGSVTDVDRYCDARNVASLDAVVCGLPWAAFDENLQDAILTTMSLRLASDARFATFAYLQGLALPAGRRFARKLHDRFGEVTTSRVVWRNLPPAIIYRCRP